MKIVDCIAYTCFVALALIPIFAVIAHLFGLI
jgi:hypothetical protein